MPKVRNVEKAISKKEGFEVKIELNGKNVRGDKELPKQYAAERMSKNGMTVSEFKDKFKKQFPGYDITVYRKDGSAPSGQTHLGTVRDTYLEEDDKEEKE